MKQKQQGPTETPRGGFGGPANEGEPAPPMGGFGAQTQDDAPAGATEE